MGLNDAKFGGAWRRARISKNKIKYDNIGHFFFICSEEVRMRCH
jgi:hypothetical protein